MKFKLGVASVTLFFLLGCVHNKAHINVVDSTWTISHAPKPTCEYEKADKLYLYGGDSDEVGTGTTCTKAKEDYNQVLTLYNSMCTTQDGAWFYEGTDGNIGFGRTCKEALREWVDVWDRNYLLHKKDLTI